MHNVTQNDQLDFFILMGSAAGVYGSTGQANYCAAATFLESFCKYRQQLGLPCSVLDLGIVGGIGLISRNDRILRPLQALSRTVIEERQLLECFQLVVYNSRHNSASPLIVGLCPPSNIATTDLRTSWTHDARLTPAIDLTESSGQSHRKAANNRLKALATKAKQEPHLFDDLEMRDCVRTEIGELVANYMPGGSDMDEEEISKCIVDSLMAVELKGWIKRNIGVEISVGEISQAGTVGPLADLIVDRAKMEWTK